MLLARTCTRICVRNSSKLTLVQRFKKMIFGDPNYLLMAPAHPLERSAGEAREYVISKLRGDRKFDLHCYRWSRATTLDKANVVPCRFENQIIGCVCDPDLPFSRYMWIRKGHPKRCECGYWFKLVDEPEEEPKMKV